MSSVLINGVPPAINGFILQINEIIESIETNNLDNAKNKFVSFLKNVKTIGPYNSLNWREQFTQKVYDLSELIANKYLDLLELVKQEITISNQIESEVLYFIESEILFTIWSNPEDRTLSYFLDLSRKYPTNAEFIHDIGHIENAKANYLGAINYYLTAIKLYPTNSIFLKSCLSPELNYVESLIIQEKFDTAMDYINNVLTVRKTYAADANYTNWFLSIQSRIEDHKLIRSTLAQKEADIESRLASRFEKERFKAIEMIGVFTAIIAFIFSTISISTKYALNEAILLEITFGLVLILFAVSISVILSPKGKEVFKDIRIYSILLILLSLISIYWFNK